MGQQQILLLLLVTIIVGIATVVAITTFDDTRTSSNHESIKLKMIDAQGLARTYHSKMQALGGGSHSFRNITLGDLNISEESQLGTFSISEANDESFKLTVIPSSGGENIIGVIYTDSISFAGAVE